jgi:hypothetical protein
MPKSAVTGSPCTCRDELSGFEGFFFLKNCLKYFQAATFAPRERERWAPNLVIIGEEFLSLALISAKRHDTVCPSVSAAYYRHAPKSGPNVMHELPFKGWKQIFFPGGSNSRRRSGKEIFL